MASTRAQEQPPGMLHNNGRTPSSSSAAGTYYPGAHSDEQSLYSSCARVPLIKSPNVRVPPVVTLPPTLHPLPPNLHDYFVYPFSLEKMVLDAADRRERARKEDMQRRAPGWSGGANDVLEPTKKRQPQQASSGDLLDGDESSTAQQQPSQHDDIDEMARMLDEMGRGR